METITRKFQDKEIRIRTLQEIDIKKAKKFQVFVNELVIDNTALVRIKTKQTLKEERGWVKGIFEKMKRSQAVMLIAEHNNKVIASTSVRLLPYTQNHIASFGIAILKEYRSIGLGRYLMSEILKLTKTKLKPKIIKLGAFSTNKIAISLYKKMGFKIVATIPKQISFNNKLIDEVIMLKFEKTGS